MHDHRSDFSFSPFRISWLALLASLLTGTSALAQEDPGIKKKDPLDFGTFSFYFENDMFGGTDQHYTNGVRLAWTTAALEKFSDNPFTGPLSSTLDDLPFINNPGYQRNVAFALGQAMYTPSNIRESKLIEDDRPYAGWLYVDLGLIWKNAFTRHTLSLEVGIVGPWSFAHETQDLVHELRGIGKAQGWDNQLENEFGAVISYERMWRFPFTPARSGLGWELLPFAGASVGNVITAARLGAEFRAGWNLPDDFGAETISAAATTSTPMEGGQRATRTRSGDFGIHAFIRGEGRAVAHNIFLDGNTFKDSHSVNKETFVGEIGAGIAINYRDIKVTYSYVYRTEEFKGQDGGQTFGSITLTVPF